MPDNLIRGKQLNQADLSGTIQNYIATANLSVLTGSFDKLYATNLVYNTGNQPISGNKTFSNQIIFENEYGRGGSISGSTVGGDSSLFITADGPEAEYIFLNAGPASINLGEGGININNGNNPLYFNGSDDIYINNTRSLVGSNISASFLSGSFFNRPTVNGSGVLLVGEAAGLPSSIVYASGNQVISGVKSFVNNTQFSGSGIFNSGINLNNINDLSLSGVNVTITDANTIVRINNTPYTPLGNNPLSVVGSGNSYIQLNIQNKATGTAASSDLVITANAGSDSNNYLDLGINNTGYNQPDYSISSSGDGYLYINGGNLTIGTQTIGKIIKFHVDGTTSADQIVVINRSGILSPNLVYNTGNQIISGNKTFSGNTTISGNLSVSGSGIFNALDLNNIDNLSLSGVDITITSGIVILTNPVSAPNLVYNTGNQTISGIKTFISSGVFSLSGAQATGLPNNPLSVVGSGNTYLQLNIQNRATGTDASADLVITANNGTDNSNYINLGINNSGYNNASYNNATGYDGYLFIDGGDLDIGTRTPNKIIEFHAGGTTESNIIARISQSGLNIVSGNLTVSNTGVLLSGSTPFTMNFGHKQNTPTTGPLYQYFGPQMDIDPVSLANNEKRRVQIAQDCYLRKVIWTSIAKTAAPTPTNAMTGYFKNFGNNPLTDDQTAGVQVTSVINIPASNIMYANSTGTLNIPIKSGDYISFYYQSNFSVAPTNLAVNVDGYFYV